MFLYSVWFVDTFHSYTYFKRGAYLLLFYLTCSDWFSLPQKKICLPNPEERKTSGKQSCMENLDELEFRFKKSRRLILKIVNEEITIITRKSKKAWYAIENGAMKAAKQFSEDLGVGGRFTSKKVLCGHSRVPTFCNKSKKCPSNIWKKLKTPSTTKTFLSDDIDNKICEYSKLVVNRWYCEHKYCSELWQAGDL